MPTTKPENRTSIVACLYDYLTFGMRTKNAQSTKIVDFLADIAKRLKTLSVSDRSMNKKQGFLYIYFSCLFAFFSCLFTFFSCLFTFISVVYIFSCLFTVSCQFTF